MIRIHILDVEHRAGNRIQLLILEACAQPVVGIVIDSLNPALTLRNNLFQHLCRYLALAEALDLGLGAKLAECLINGLLPVFTINGNGHRPRGLFF